MTCDLPGLLVSIRRLREECAPSPELALAEALTEALLALAADWPADYLVPHEVNRWLGQADEELRRSERRAGLRPQLRAGELR